jgi:Niemann-Pick C1 protein
VGVLVLALAQSTLFRLYYFRMYLGIILLGLFNGLVLLPVALYWFGPKTDSIASN